MNYSSIEIVVEELRKGGIVIVIDNPDRENEGDLVMAAEFITEEKMAFFIHYTGGIICVPCKKELMDSLEIGMMVENNSDYKQTAFTVSIDFSKGTTTGISASDRAMTVKALTDDKVLPKDFTRPGHIFPLVYTEGGVLAREGHTEAGVDLMNLSGLKPVAVISELMNEDGSMMRNKELLEFSKKWNMPILSVQDIKNYRQKMSII
jgi:3,4-dihydroxy 2-butanone 4-phosphate synthase/GTP cyclohydrolase II